MAKIDISDSSLKGLREALCAAQNGLNRSGMGTSLTQAQSAYISDLIRQIDVFRPLDTNGKHGDLHTAHCGCEDSDIKICKFCEREIIQLTGNEDDCKYWVHVHSALTKCWSYIPSANAEPVLELES